MRLMSKAAIGLSSCLLALSAQAQNAASIDSQIDELEKQVQALENSQKRHDNRIKSISEKSLGKDISFNGFMSIGLSQFNKQVEQYDTGQDDELSFLPNSWFGFQMNADLYEGAEFVVQVVAQGHKESSEAFELETEWLYLKQDLGAGFDAQFGRIRFPLFQESQNFFVGNTYPWISPPVSVYGVLELTSVDGVSVNHRFNFGDWYLDTKALLWADAELPFEGTGNKATLDNLKGLTLNFANDEMSFRVAYMRAQQDWDARISAGAFNLVFDYGDDLEYMVQSFKYDNAQIYASAEAIQVKAEHDILPEDNSWNTTLGWYFGEVLVYVGYSKTDVDNGDEIAANIIADYTRRGMFAGNPLAAVVTRASAGASQTVFNEKQETYMTGVKWNFHPKATFKVQVSRLSDFDGTIGNFGEAQSQPGVRPLPDDLYLWETAIQAVF